MRAWWLLAMLVACGDEPPADDGARSGSRLRIAWFDFDGTRQWQPEQGRHYEGGRFVNSEVYFDRERGETCAPEPWLDGVVRCTPDVELSPRKVFADAACTMRVTENPRTFAYVGDYDDRCGVRRMWHVFGVARVMARTELYYIAADGLCYPTSSSAAELGVLGDELAPDVFARVETKDTGGKRLQIRSRTSDDGLALPLGFYDARLGPSDVVHVDGDVAMPRGAVSAAANVLFYADAACARAFVRVERGCPAPPSATVDSTTYFAIGERAATAPGYAHPFAECQPLAAMPDGDFYEVLTAAPQALVPLTIARAADPMHRIVVQHASAAGVSLRLRALFDVQLASDCVPRRFPDDVIRCAPDPAAAEVVPGIFADPACQVPLELAHVLPGHRAPGLVIQDRTLLGGALKVFALGDRYTDAMYAFGGADGVTCTIAEVADAYRLGRLVDWSELAVGVLATD